MKVSEAIRRYGEREPEEWNKMVKRIQENVHLNFLIEYLNRKEPKFYFRILPSGSIREKFGFPDTPRREYPGKIRFPSSVHLSFG